MPLKMPCSTIAIDYWRLPKDATLKDVITVIRADEAHHRDVNHFASVLSATILNVSLLVQYPVEMLSLYDLAFIFNYYLEFHLLPRHIFSTVLLHSPDLILNNQRSKFKGSWAYK